MRVAIDGRVMQDRYHGIGRHTYELTSHLAEHSDLDLVVFRDPDAPARLDVGCLGERANVELRDFRAPVVSLSAQRAWARAVAAADADVLLVPYHLAVPLLGGRVPVVAVLHDCIFEREPAHAPHGRWFAGVYRSATWLTLTRSTVVATVSEATRSDVDHFYGVRIGDDAVLPHGVGTQFFAGPPADGTPAERPVAGPYILHVGVHRPHKNHAMLIRAFAEVSRLRPEVRLVLVGQVDERFPDTVSREIARHGLGDRVVVLSHVDEAGLLALYRHAQVFAFPSLFEGFGLPVLEAMAAGAPVVASDAAAVVEASNGAALIVPAADAARWASALVQVLGDAGLAQRMRAHGRQVAAEHTWARSAERTLHLLRRAAATSTQVRSR